MDRRVPFRSSRRPRPLRQGLAALPALLLCLLCLTGGAAASEPGTAPDWPAPAPAPLAELLSGGASVDTPEQARLRSLLRALDPAARLPVLEIFNPLARGVYPGDAAAPRLSWERTPDAAVWLAEIRLPDGRAAGALLPAPEWTPTPALWTAIRSATAGGDCRLSVTALDAADRDVARGSVIFGVSRDPLDAAILYQQIPLPFLFAQDHPERSRWLLADPASPERPRVIFGGMRHCGNCHTFSPDSRMFGMDIDYDKDKGGYVFTPVAEHMVVDEKAMFSWNAYRPEDGLVSMGLFSKISPDGEHVVSTVQEKSMFSPLNDVEFCQFFYPIRGHLAVYSRRDGRILALPGADDPGFVQTSPAWSPDGERIAFARAPLDPHLLEVMDGRTFLPPGEDRIEDFNARLPYRYDLYAVDFNDGRGGTPRPLVGGHAEGMSSYFPRYSPDGRWIVFCRGETGLVLQPSSELWIIPAEGGEARRLECNTELLNSWHSFSPNGRWIVFSSKQNTPYTEVFAAHLDRDGHAQRPVLLDRLGHPALASIIPEAADRSVLRIRSIELARP